MRESNLNSSALLVRWIALPLALAAVSCSGGTSDSQVGEGVAPPVTVPGSGGGPVLMLPPPGSDAGAGNSTGGAGSTRPGTYMLPADYTAATLGGFKLGAPVEAGEPGGAGAPGAGGSNSSCGTSILGIVRDFKGANEPGGHPDFEAFAGTTASKGIVEATLGADQKPVYASTSAFTDKRNGQQTTSKANFDQWYRGTPDVNKPFIVYFYFEPSKGVLTFQSNAFFPLDGKGWGNTCAEPGASCPQWPHNFGFSTELHTQFTYKGGETFSFTGDDDLWVFINRKLAIDLGGLHSKLSDTLLLDKAAKTLGISVGGVYDLDLFHAERHTDASNFRVDTNLAFTNCGTIVEEPPVK